MLQIKPWATLANTVDPPAVHDKVKLASTDYDALNARILKLVTDLGNTVLAKRAANDLHG